MSTMSLRTPIDIVVRTAGKVAAVVRVCACVGYFRHGPRSEKLRAFPVSAVSPQTPAAGSADTAVQFTVCRARQACFTHK